jgi:uncharacterized protein with GYD domain
MPIDREGAGESDEAAFRVMGTIGVRVELAEDREPSLPATPRATRMSPVRTISATHEKDGGHDSLASRRVEGFGGKLHSYYIAFGEFDGVAICEFPNNTAAAACSMSVAATGGFSRFETTTLLTAKEAEAAMTQANKTKTEYKPPHA